MVVEFTTTYAINAITTNIVSSNSTHCEVYLIQHYVIKFVSDLQQVSGFLQVLQFPSPIKTDCHDITEILLKVVLNIITLTVLLSYIYLNSINHIS
jgi:hypothetical protein